MGEQRRIQILRYLEVRRGGLLRGATPEAIAQGMDVPLNVLQDELDILVAQRLLEARHDVSLAASVYLILPEGRLRLEEVEVPASGAPKRAIFISWSGSESQAVATAIRDLLLATLGGVETFLSSDLAKGTRWNQQLGAVLDSTCYGILCVVPGNAGAPWLNFEAGALSKSVERGGEDHPCVAPFLVDAKPEDLPATLGQFNATLFDREDVLKLLETLNRVTMINRPEKQLMRAFETAWPGFREKVEKRTRSGPATGSAEGSEEEEVPDMPLEAWRVLQFMAADLELSRSADAIAGELGLKPVRVRALWAVLKQKGLVSDRVDGPCVTDQGLRCLYDQGLC